MAEGEKGSSGLFGSVKTLGAVTGIGLEFAMLVVLGALGGQWLDARWGSGPWLTLVGIAAGLVLCGLQLWRLMVYLKKRETPQEPAER